EDGVIEAAAVEEAAVAATGDAVWARSRHDLLVDVVLDEGRFRRRADARRVALAGDAARLTGGRAREEDDRPAAEVAVRVVRVVGGGRGAGARRGVRGRRDARADAEARGRAAAEVARRVLEGAGVGLASRAGARGARRRVRGDAGTDRRVLAG